MVIGGFPKDCLRDIRQQGDQVIWDRVKAFKDNFVKPFAIYNEGRIALARNARMRHGQRWLQPSRSTGRNPQSQSRSASILTHCG